MEGRYLPCHLSCQGWELHSTIMPTYIVPGVWLV